MSAVSSIDELMSYQADRTRTLRINACGDCAPYENHFSSWKARRENGKPYFTERVRLFTHPLNVSAAWSGIRHYTTPMAPQRKSPLSSRSLYSDSIFRLKNCSNRSGVERCSGMYPSTSAWLVIVASTSSPSYPPGSRTQPVCVRLCTSSTAHSHRLDGHRDCDRIRGISGAT